MPDELFRTLVVRRQRGRRFGAVPLSLAVHVVVIVLAVIIPLLATDVLPLVSIPLVMQVTKMPAVVVPPPPSPPAARRAVAVPAAQGPGTPLEAPAGITNTGVAPVDPIPEIRSSEIGTIPGIGQPLPFEPPPVAPPTEVQSTVPVKIGGKVLAPRRIRCPAPVYPPLAIAAHVEGTVVIEAIISATGSVQQVRVVTSVPLLDEAALAAVRQWVFTPTLLNGTPVPVIMTVKVEFKLQR